MEQTKLKQHRKCKGKHAIELRQAAGHPAEQLPTFAVFTTLIGKSFELIEAAYLSKIVWKAVPQDGSCKSVTFLAIFCCANLRHLQNT